MKHQRKLITLCTLGLVAFILTFALLGAVCSATNTSTEPAFQLNCPTLEGYWSDQKDLPKLTVSEWLNGSFQKNFDNWFSAHCGARNPLIRLNNQLLYALFRRSYMFQGRIAVCDHDALYMTNYVADYFHQCNAADVENVRHFVNDLAQLQTALAKRQIACVFLITPSKAKSYPPGIQAPWDKRPVPDRRIYDELVKQLDEHHIKYIDGRKITSQLEAAHAMQTFTPGGIHWTQVAAATTLNAVIAEINKQSDKSFPLIKTTNRSFGPPDAIERDLAAILNLLKPNYKYQVEHAQYGPSDPNWKNQGKIVFEGTSFVEQLTTVAFNAKMFDRMRHYFYYTSALNIFPEVKKLDVDAAKIDWEHEILDADAIVIEDNEGLPFDHCQHFVSDALKQINSNAVASRAPTHIQ